VNKLEKKGLIMKRIACQTTPRADQKRPATNISIFSSILNLGRGLALAFVLLGLGAALTNQPLFSQTIIDQKSCGRCGKQVSLSSVVGDNCPHCGAYWGAQENSYREVPAPPARRKPAASPGRSSPAQESLTFKPSKRLTWPRYAHFLGGPKKLVVENHGSPMWLALRSGASGADIWLETGAMGCFDLEPGTYKLYACSYPGGRATLLEGGTITIPKGRGGTRKLCLWTDEES
jgi:hypothetical protein